MKLKKEYKLGILAVVVLVSSFFVINYLRGKDIFNKEIQLVGYFDDLETLVASAPVQIRGYAAGRVEKVEYCTDTDNFRVICSVDKQFRVPSDSRMMIYSTSIMGGKGVKIAIGSADSLVKDGDVLATGSEADILSMLSEMVGPLVGKIGSTLDTLNAVMNNVNDVMCDANKESIQSSLRHLNSTLASFNRLAASIGGKSEQINSIVDNLSSLSEKLSPLADSATGTMDNLKSITAHLDSADLGGTVSTVNTALSDVDQTVKEIQQPLNDLLSNLDDLIEKIKENPKKYLKISVF